MIIDILLSGTVFAFGILISTFMLTLIQYCSSTILIPEPKNTTPILLKRYQKTLKAFCDAPHSWRHPLYFSILYGCIAIYCTHAFSDTIYTPAWLSFSYISIALIWLDIKYYLLPDLLTLGLLWLGLFFNLENTFIPLQYAVWGAILGYLGMAIFAWSFKIITQKDGLGFGDVKLVAALGAWFGPFVIPKLLILASSIGILAYFIYFRPRKISWIPFGAALLISMILIKLIYLFN